MPEQPDYLLSTAQSTDPLKAGALGSKNGHWSGAPLKDEVIKYHPNLSDILATATMPEELEPYFTAWYSSHQPELNIAQSNVEAYLKANWADLLSQVEDMTNTQPWNFATITISLSSLYPSTYWSDSSTIDLYYQASEIGRDLLHELIHLRTEHLFGQDWFMNHHLTGQQKAVFMELLAEILLARSNSDLAQSARSPYPFFKRYKHQIQMLQQESNLMTLASLLAKEVKATENI